MNSLLRSLFVLSLAVCAVAADEVGSVDKLVDDGTVVELDVQIADGKNVVIALKQGEQPESVAAVFCKQYGIDASNIPSLVAALEKRLPPIIATLPLTLAGDVPVNLKLYEGWHIDDTVAKFVNFHQLDQQAYQILVENVEALMPLVTLTIAGTDGKAIDPPLKFLKGQSPDIAALEYCFEHDLSVQDSVHIISQEIRSRVPQELADTFPALRRVKFIVPFQVDENQIRRTPFYENDVPSDFSQKLCANFQSGDGCYDRMLNFVNAKIEGAGGAGVSPAAAKAQPAPSDTTVEPPADEQKDKASTNGDGAEKTQDEVPSAETKTTEKSEIAASFSTVDTEVVSESATASSDVNPPPVQVVRGMVEPFWAAVREALPDNVSGSLPDDPLVSSAALLGAIGMLFMFLSSGPVKPSKPAAPSNSKAKNEEKEAREGSQDTDAKESKKKAGKKSGRRSHTPSRK
jgi:hypothetical protein